MEEVILGNICNVKSSKRIYQNEYTDGGVPFYRGKEISELSRGDNPKVELYISRERYNELELKFSAPKKGDLLITSVGTIGNTWVSDGREFYYKDGNITQIVNNDKINTKYLSYLFKSDILKRQYLRESTGTAQIALTIEKLNKLVIPITSLESQEKIVASLDTAKELIDKRKTQIEELDELIKSVFYDMFGDPIRNNKKIKTCKLGEIGEWRSGGTPSRSNTEYFKGDIRWLSSGELNSIYCYDSIEKITEEAIKNSGAKMIKVGSLLLGMYDTAALKSTINLVPCTCNQAIVYSKLNNKMVNTKFVYYCIQLSKDFYKSQQRGVRQKNFNLSMIKEIKVLFPSLNEQEKFALLFDNINNKKGLLQQSLTELENNFNSLMQRAFKGELFK